MNRRFWQWVHDRLEKAWHWVYRAKLAKPINPPQDVMYGTGRIAGMSHHACVEVDRVEYWASHPDGTYTLLDGPTDTAVIR